jgi:hypothetical protein
MSNNKGRELYLRRKADRQGLRLSKSGRRDPQACDYGLYALIDIQTDSAVNPALANRWAHSWSLAQVEAYLFADMHEKVAA